MPLKRMSYNTAEKVVDIYAGLLENLTSLPKYQRYGYSSMQGFDIVDISNALKIIIAYDYFNLSKNDKVGTERVEKYVMTASSSMAGNDLYIYPDGIAKQLEQIDNSNEQEAFLEWCKLTQPNEDYPWIKMKANLETPDSFFRYCLHIGNNDPDYWEKVYERIGISWETNDPKDKIYIMVENKDIFARRFNYEGKVTEKISEPVDKIPTHSFYKRYEYEISCFLIFGLIGASVFIPFLQKVTLIVYAILSAFRIYFWGKPIKRRLYFAYCILFFISVTLSIFISSMSYYMILYILIWTIIELVTNKIISVRKASIQCGQ